ncbi:MAG: sulfatase-like hydrolase/transferase [Bacilli bacterium]|nr:sulfatase-like hydrolase/transferase [Bacilli bacterium]
MKYLINKIQNYFTKLFKKIKKINFKEVIKNIIPFLIKNKFYVFMFMSLYILDLSTRIMTNSIGFVHFLNPYPNMFTTLYLLTLVFLVKNLKNVYGKLLYGLFYAFSFVMFLVHNLYYIYFKVFFDFSVLTAASEGSSYLLDTLKDIKFWMYIVIIISIVLVFLTYKNFNKNRTNNKKIILKTLIVFIIVHLILPFTFGGATTSLEWNAWKNKRNVYNTFNDNNKCMELVGMFEYNVRNFYVTYFKKTEEESDEVLSKLDAIFESNVEHQNQYTGMFEGKNLIFLQLESIDTFLTTEEIMPNLASLRSQSINFTDHYSFVNGGGSTFNSEFMINTGYATPYTYNQNAYTFSKNNFDYSLPNLFKKVGYTVNAFHMNSSEYYSRGVNYKNFGYDSYNGLKDLKTYTDKSYELDTELLKNEEFNSKIFNVENPLNSHFVSYIISYTAHTPFSKDKGTCNMLLTEEQREDENFNPTEFECMKIQAKETDDMIGLLIENLKEKNLYDDTVIIVYADHYAYTLTDKSILELTKDTSTNLINHTDCFIWASDIEPQEVTKTTSQLNIMPTILNLFNLYVKPNYYIGEDALDPNYLGYVFFSDYSWWDGKRYVALGDVIKGLPATEEYITEMSNKINDLIYKNDEVLKTNYFKKLKNKETNDN